MTSVDKSENVVPNKKSSSQSPEQVLLKGKDLADFKQKYGKIINDANHPNYAWIWEEFPGITAEEVKIIALLREYNSAVDWQLFLSRERFTVLKNDVTPVLNTFRAPVKKIASRSTPKIQKWPKVLPRTPTVVKPTQSEPLVTAVEKAPDFTEEQKKADIAIRGAMKWMSINGSFYSQWDLKNPDYALVKQPDGEFYLWDKPVGDKRMIFKLNTQLKVIGCIPSQKNTVITVRSSNMTHVPYTPLEPAKRP